ncbi:MAG: chromosome segregation ATPase, partial [Bacillariaceae sp.]
SHADLKNQLEEEIQRRKTLEVTYKQLNEFRTKQTSQLEVITSSRNNYRNETIELKKVLEKERKQNLETVSALRSAAEAIVPVVESQRSKENDKLKHDIETLHTKIHKKDERYASSESLVKSLTKEVETLNADLKNCRQNYESTIQTTIENHSKEMEYTQVRIVSEWTEKINKIKENEQTILEQVRKKRTLIH